MSCLKTSISMENVIVVGNRLRNFESNYPTKLHREFWPTGCKKKELTWIRTRFNELSMETAGNRLRRHGYGRRLPSSNPHR